MSGSSLLRREEVLKSEACLEWRKLRGDDFTSRGGCSEREDFLGEREVDLVGDGGSGLER